jgi:hypothetical protein
MEREEGFKLSKTWNQIVRIHEIDDMQMKPGKKQT